MWSQRQRTPTLPCLGPPISLGRYDWLWPVKVRQASDNGFWLALFHEISFLYEIRSKKPSLYSPRTQPRGAREGSGTKGREKACLSRWVPGKNRKREIALIVPELLGDIPEEGTSKACAELSQFQVYSKGSSRAVISWMRSLAAVCIIVRAAPVAEKYNDRLTGTGANVKSSPVTTLKLKRTC